MEGSFYHSRMVIRTDYDASREFLAKELAAVEASLAETERKQLHQANADQSSHQREGGGPLVVRLAKLERTTNSLILAQDVTEWMDDSPVTQDGDIFAEAKLCNDLARLLLRHDSTILELYPSLYEETYLSLYAYLRESLVVLLRQELAVHRYPKPDGCAKLLKECRKEAEEEDSKPLFPRICHCLERLEQSHIEVLRNVAGESTATPHSTLLIELFTPIVERIRFHFVERDPSRITSTRIDKLPEWLLTYLRDNVLLDGPYILVREGLVKGSAQQDHSDTLSIPFLQETVRLVQWVLTERNFFRDPKITGSRSNPLLLCNAMEQILQFDKTIQECMPLVVERESVWAYGLMDLIVVPDQELMQWWMTREKESVFSTLFEDESTVNVPKPLANHVSPRAEIFCALIRSTQTKASVFAVPGPYLRQVAVPLCSQFVDALHDTSTDLRNLMCQKGELPSEAELVANVHEWIEIINGTHLAANVLLREGAWQDGMPNASQSDHDLARFGRSLEQLRDVMVEEFASSFVETILMERAKLASYLMMASHLLASEQWDGDETDLSAELRETKVILSQFHQVCNSILIAVTEDDEEANDDLLIAHFAPVGIRKHVMNRVADKFLEVVLDVHEITPNIWREGAKIFARDIQVVFGSSDLPSVKRLLDISRLLSMDSKSLEGLFAALAGLVGAETFLDIHDFSEDGTILEEATSMVKAKGFAFIHLEDVVSILNRRRD